MNNLFYQLKIAIRNLRRGGLYSAINIGGLAIGMAATMLIMLWVYNQWSYDRFHKKSEQLYQIWTYSETNGYMDKTVDPLGPALQDGYPEFTNVTRYNQTDELPFERDGKNETIVGAFVDPTFFRMFSFSMLQGNAGTALDDPFAAVLTKNAAMRIFGNEDPMGQTIKVTDRLQLTVAGVLADLPDNTIFRFDLLLSYQLRKISGADFSWTGKPAVYTFVELNPRADADIVDAAICKVIGKYTGGWDKTEVFLHPASKWHLYTRFENKKAVGGLISTLQMFTLIALLILLIACINFMNLSTAQSARYAREVGVRKVLGARRGMMVRQFLGESVLMVVVAAVVAVVVVQLCLPFYNSLVGKQLGLEFGNAGFWFVLLLFVLFTGVLAGSYPAFYLTSFLPVKALKGILKVGHELVTPRKALIVLQFTFAVILIISTMIIHRQINHAQERNTGYDRSQLIHVNMDEPLRSRKELIRRELLESGAVRSVSFNFAAMTGSQEATTLTQWRGKDPNSQAVFERNYAQADWAQTTGVRILQGRDIDIYTYPTDSTAMLLNETAVKAMGFTDPIGETVREFGREYHVVGVVQDFVLESPFEPIRPMTIGGPAGWLNHIHIKLNDAHSVTDNLAIIEAIFRKYNPDLPFLYHFADELYARRFREAQRISSLVTGFAVLAVFISCLGLFGLSAYMAGNRRKEIGVRKVLGASVVNIASLLSREFMFLVVISLAIATPVSWWAMSRWLEGFAYRTNMPWWMFAAVAVLTMGIALLTVGWQAIKAATANPVKSLKTE